MKTKTYFEVKNSMEKWNPLANIIGMKYLVHALVDIAQKCITFLLMCH